MYCSLTGSSCLKKVQMLHLWHPLPEQQDPAILAEESCLQLRKCHIAADALKNVPGMPWNVWTVTTVVPSPKPRIATWRSNIWSLGLIARPSDHAALPVTCWKRESRDETRLG